MTPKEKAEDLVLKYLRIDNNTKEWFNIHIAKQLFNIHIAKQCALIAVDELIYETSFEVPNIRQKYWQEVKQEIEKL